MDDRQTDGRSPEESPRANVRNPFPNHAWPQVWDWIQPYRRSVLDDHSPKTKPEFVDEQLVRVKTPTYRTWGVLRETQLGGLVTFQTTHPGDTMGWAQTIFRKNFFGPETTFHALHAVFNGLFGEGIQVIRSEIFQSNSNIRHLSRLLGFREYGPFPKSATRGGELIDVVGLFLTTETLNANPSRSDHRRTRQRRGGTVLGPGSRPDSRTENSSGGKSGESREQRPRLSRTIAGPATFTWLDFH